jgi:general secretion pathway protein D
VKAILPFILLAALLPSAMAQPKPTNGTPAMTPPKVSDTYDDLVRRVLYQEYLKIGVTTAPPGQVTAPAAATNLAATLSKTNGTPAAPTAAAAAVTPPTNQQPASAAAAPARPVVPSPGAPPPTVTGPGTTRPAPGQPAARPPGQPGIAQPTAAAVPPGGAARPPVTPPGPAAPAPAAPGAAAPGGADQPPGANIAAGLNPDEEILQPGMIKFQDTDLLQVLEIYQELTGRTVLRPATLPQTKISIKSQTALTRREGVQALDSVLSLNGITMMPQGDKFVKAVPFGQAFSEALKFNAVPPDQLPESGTLVSHIYQLKHAVPTEVQPAVQAFAKLPNSILAINSSGILILRDYAENVKRMVEILDKIDIVTPSEFESIVIPIKYALAADIAQVLGSLTAGGGGATTVGRQETRTGLTTPGGGRQGLQGGTGIPGQQGYQQPGTLGSQTGLGSQAAQRSSFADRLRNIVQRASQGGDIVVLGDTKIIADERTNSLLIFATEQDIKTIKDIIEKLDVVLAQVLIEALIMEVSLGDSLDYGFSYRQTSPSGVGSYFTGIGAIKNLDFLSFQNFASGVSNAVPGGFSYFGKFGNDFEATLVAAASDSRVNVLSRPRIQTSHAVEANLFVGNTRPYVTGTYSYFGGGPQTQFQQQQIGITLSVLPLINPDGLVVMDIRQKIQSIGEDIPIDANFSVPETIDREANAKVAVRDRETIILGGFISSERRSSKSGVPLLKDIPLLGALFRNTSKNMRRSELIVLLRPTVLQTPQIAAEVATEEKAKMPGVVRAEREMLKSEREHQQKSAKELLRKEGMRY